MIIINHQALIYRTGVSPVCMFTCQEVEFPFTKILSFCSCQETLYAFIRTKPIFNFLSHSSSNEILSEIMYEPKLKSSKMSTKIEIYATSVLIEFQLWQEILCLWVKGLIVKLYLFIYLF